MICNICSSSLVSLFAQICFSFMLPFPLYICQTNLQRCNQHYGTNFSIIYNNTLSPTKLSVNVYQLSKYSENWSSLIYPHPISSFYTYRISVYIPFFFYLWLTLCSSVIRNNFQFCFLKSFFSFKIWLSAFSLIWTSLL